MTRIDLKHMHSKKLRELRKMIREELDFRAEIGEQLEDGRIKEWVSATEWSARVQQQDKKEERERSYAYIEELSTNIALGNFDDLNNKIKEAQQQQQDHPQKTTIGRMESMRDWNRSK